MSDFLRPEDLTKITTDVEMTKARKEMDSAHKKEEEAKVLHDMFMTREIQPQAKDRINNAVRRAASNGLREVEIFTFPASFTNDGGRRINNNEPDWPASLDGFAKKAYDYYEKELRPLGYKLQVRVLNYPGGMIGEIGVYLCW
ncbi:MAG TPA: hypothetical protein VEJ16_18835 [Alphaproteobacteria bacterium]|jgi:hypothetical protein|nr:hypothetical protein [Alphaproteobacteria bacterium]